MESDRIEQLLEKYFEATTDVAEEQMIRSYFSGKNVAPHLKKYAPMFQYFSETKKEGYSGDVDLPRNKRPIIHLYKWASVAAAVILFLGIYFWKDAPTTSLEQEYTQEEIASAREAMALLAQNFNKGTEQLSHLEEFEKNTNKFLIKD